jgi:uncharacterized protein YpiB (UPF0302 family)
MTDIVSTFNRLTNNELADDNLFKDILEEHYDKFRYFYNIIKTIDEDRLIDDMICNANKEGLEFILSFASPEDSYEYKELFDTKFSKINDTYYRKYFKHITSSSNCDIIIKISCNLQNESDVYGKHYNAL